MDAALIRLPRLLCGLMLVAGACALPAGAAPIGWRIDGTGIFPDAKPPTEWSDKSNVLWKTKLPGPSFGSPILVGDKLYVVSDPDVFLCMNPADGAIVWQRSHPLDTIFDAETARKIGEQYTKLRADRERLRREQGKADADKKAEIKKELDALEMEWNGLAKKYPQPPAISGMRGSTNSGATPSCDGKNIFALFGNGILVAYTLGGEKLWVKYIESSPIHFGHASSPVLVGGKVLVHIKDLVAVDPKDGAELWRTPLNANYATPVPLKVGDTDVVIDPAGAVVRVSDGMVLLQDGKLGTSECTPIVQDGIIYATHGTARALKLAPAGDDKVKVEQLWQAKLQGGRRTPSGVLHDGKLYTVTTDGKMDVLDAKTGDLVYQHQFRTHEFYTSLTSAGKYLFAGCTRGTAFFFEPGNEYKEVARNQIETFGSTPVFQGERMYLRTKQWLYCFGK